MKVSVVIPAYNEAGRIGETLEILISHFRQTGEPWEIIVVDDGSTDGTARVVKEAAAALGPGAEGSRLLRVITIAHRGKGAAVAAGVAAAAGDWILMSDADLSTPIAEWPKLREALEGGAAIAVGSRQAPGAEVLVSQPWWRQRMGMLFGGLVRRMFPIGVIDSQCGFKGFAAGAARELFGSLVTEGYCFDVELLVRARQRGLPVAEVPVKWLNHPDSRVHPWKDWPRVMRELLRIRRLMKNSSRPGSRGSPEA